MGSTDSEETENLEGILQELHPEEYMRAADRWKKKKAPCAETT